MGMHWWHFCGRLQWKGAAIEGVAAKGNIGHTWAGTFCSMVAQLCRALMLLGVAVAAS